MNCESWFLAKKSRITVVIAFVFTRRWIVNDSVFCSDAFMRSRTSFSVRAKPILHWFARSSPAVLTRRLLKLSMSSIIP